MSPEQQALHDEIMELIKTYAYRESAVTYIKLSTAIAQLCAKADWKEAVIQACITANLEWDENPRATVEKLIQWHCDMALDPAISERAAKPDSAEQEFGIAFQHSETGHIQCVDRFQIENGWEKNNPRWLRIGRAFLKP